MITGTLSVLGKNLANEEILYFYNRSIISEIFFLCTHGSSLRVKEQNQDVFTRRACISNMLLEVSLERNGYDGE